MDQDIDKLLEKYYNGETSLEEEKQLKRFFQKSDFPAHLQAHAAQFQYFSEAKEEQPSVKFNSQLAAMMDPPKQTPVRRLTGWLVRIAAGLALLLIGFSGGMTYFKNHSDTSVTGSESDAASVVEIKKVLAFEQTPSTSASERIQAVNQSYSLANVNQDITQLLVNTLNFDPNVNVRLAACQALLRFQGEPGVSEALIQSLGIQTDPNLQITLIEALVAIKEKRAYDQIEQLARDQEVMDVVRLKAKEGLDRLVKEGTPAT